MRPAAAVMQDKMRAQFRRQLRREIGRYLCIAAGGGFVVGALVGAGLVAWI